MSFPAWSTFPTGLGPGGHGPETLPQTERALRSGPSAWKPLAEAALAARPFTGVHATHTLLAEELPHWGPRAIA